MSDLLDKSLNNISSIVGRNLTHEETLYAKQKIIKAHSPISPSLLQLIAWEIDSNVMHPADMKEYQLKVLAESTTDDKNENMIVSSALSLSTVPSGPKQYYSYINLDSDNCYTINETRDKFTWLLNEEKIMQKTGIINLHAGFRNVVAARMGRFTINHMPVAFATTMIDRNRVGLGFDEFASQALITPDHNKFQFMMFMRETDRNYGTNITLSPFSCNRGWFRFREPFTTLSSLTLNLYNLFLNTKISLPDSYVSFSAVKHSGNTVPTPDAEVYYHTITITNGSYLPINYYYNALGEIDTVTAAVVGEQVLFSGISTGDPLLDALYNGMTKTITYIASNEFVVSGEVGQIFPTGDYPMTITLLYKPRFLGVLELVSEYDGDDLDD